MEKTNNTLAPVTDRVDPMVLFLGHKSLCLWSGITTRFYPTGLGLAYPAPVCVPLVVPTQAKTAEQSREVSGSTDNATICDHVVKISMEMV